MAELADYEPIGLFAETEGLTAICRLNGHGSSASPMRNGSAGSR
jgi:hypothetical protein